MNKRELANTGINVSEICFGTLTLGPLQRNLPVEEGIKVLLKAYEEGINFFDTAQMYKTYPYLKKLLQVDKNLIICSRSYDYSYEGLMKSLDEALEGIGRDYIDLYLLHEQESRYTFEGHYPAIEALLDAKREGKVRAIGISTHRVRAVRDSILFPELEIVFALLNKRGLGIEDGTSDDMVEAIKLARENNKAVYTMKPLGGGNLIRDRVENLNFQKNLYNKNLIDSVAIGMSSIEEVLYNVKFFEDKKIDRSLIDSTKNRSRKLLIDDWCEKCGRCIEKCHQNALFMGNNKVEVNRQKCLTCGYCASVCPVFALKVI